MKVTSSFSFQREATNKCMRARSLPACAPWNPGLFGGLRKDLARRVLALGLTALAAPLFAASIIVEDAWTRATAPLQPVAGAYMKLTSDTNAALVGASSPVAKRAEVHAMKMQDGVMFMRPVDALLLPKGQTMELKPGSYHIMLIELKRPFKVGDTVPLSLKILADNKIQTVEVKATVLDLMGNRVEHAH